jgi:predicted MFS family arabinose efflux permease
MVLFVGFELMAVVTVMPDVARALHGERWFALSFAAPLASGVVGMVATGLWSDRRGPAGPLAASLALFAVGLLICGLATGMPTLVLGRIIQGLGGGGVSVTMYVVVGVIVPVALRPQAFALLAAGWVLPTLVGPLLAAGVAHAFGWRWVFLGVVVLVAITTPVILAILRVLPAHRPEGTPAQLTQLGWAALAGLGVLALDLIGGGGGWRTALALAVMVVVLVAARPLLPGGTLAVRPGLPSVVLTRGALAAGFMSGEIYVPYALQERWGWSTLHAGMVLAAAGLTWTSASFLQARLRAISDRRVLAAGTLFVLTGLSLLTVVIGLRLPAGAFVAAYAVAAFGMGLSYPRTTMAALAVSTDSDRGFNSAALTIADSLGSALALAIIGLVFVAAGGVGPAAFVAAYVVTVCWAVLAVAAARRSAALPGSAPATGSRE